MEGKDIVKGLKLCKDSFCEDCPYRQYTINCRDHLVEDALSFIEALQWTNRHLIKTEKEKHRELWNEAVKQFLEKVKEYQKSVCFDEAFVAVDIEDIEFVAKEMTNQIKE